MSCEAAESELVHFLAAGTLDPAEREQALRHAAACDECGAELRALELLVADVRALHLTVPELIAAAGRGREPEHLRECAACRGEYQLLRHVNRDLAGRPSGLSWRVPAGAAAALLLGFNLWLVLQNRELVQRAERAESEQAAGQQARREAQALQAELGDLKDRLERPQLNVTVVDVEPPSALRGAASRAQEIVVPAGAEAVTVILSAPGVAHHSRYRLELAVEGREVWSGDGLARSEFDTFTISFPRRLLPAGTCRLRLADPGGATLREWTVAVRYLP